MYEDQRIFKRVLRNIFKKIREVVFMLREVLNPLL